MELFPTPPYTSPRPTPRARPRPHGIGIVHMKPRPRLRPGTLLSMEEDDSKLN